MYSTVSALSQITVNGQARALGALQTVADLVAELALDARKIAIELNQAIVPRSTYGDTALNAGDAVEIVGFIGGG